MTDSAITPESRLRAGDPAADLPTERRNAGNTMIHFDPRRIEVIDDAAAAIFRAKTPAERVAIACDAHRTARLMLSARVRSANPAWSDAQVLADVARRLTRGAE